MLIVHIGHYNLSNLLISIMSTAFHHVLIEQCLGLAITCMLFALQITLFFLAFVWSQPYIRSYRAFQKYKADNIYSFMVDENVNMWQ